MLNLILDTIIPGDQSLNLPPASKVSFDEYIKSYSKDSLIAEFLNLANQVSTDTFGSNFLALSQEDRLRAIEACKRKDIRLFVDFITNLFRAYYTNKAVLESINSGSIPPFPMGNMLENDDWEILEPVFERGIIYRSISPEG